jgi:hypothetical protein
MGLYLPLFWVMVLQQRHTRFAAENAFNVSAEDSGMRIANKSTTRFFRFHSQRQYTLV